MKRKGKRKVKAKVPDMREARAWRDDARTQDARPKTQDCRQMCAERGRGGWEAGFYRAVEPEPRPYQRHISAKRKSGDIVLRLVSWVLRPLPHAPGIAKPFRAVRAEVLFGRGEQAAAFTTRPQGTAALPFSPRVRGGSMAVVRAGPCATGAKRKCGASARPLLCATIREAGAWRLHLIP